MFAGTGWLTVREKPPRPSPKKICSSQVVDAVARHRQQHIVSRPSPSRSLTASALVPCARGVVTPEREGPVAAAVVGLQDGDARAPIGQRHQQIDAAVPVHVGRHQMACFGVGIPASRPRTRTGKFPRPSPKNTRSARSSYLSSATMS